MARASQRVLGKALKLGEIKHLSYSTLDQWFKCPKTVELSKIQLAPRLPAWWLAGGSAVHKATEDYDRWTLLDPVQRGRFSILDSFAMAFNNEVEEISAKEPDHTLWRHAGPKDSPETYEKWMKLGPVLVGNYIKWRRATDYIIWDATVHNDGKGDSLSTAVGIEIDLSFTPPGCEKEIKAYADRILVSPSLDQVHIIDLKTGTRGPNSPLQFGVYAAGLKHLYGTDAVTGAAFMNREARLGKAFDLTKYTPAYVGRLFGNLSRAVDARVYPAHLGSSCRMCDVSSACYANDGELAEMYDPDHPEYAPRF